MFSGSAGLRLRYVTSFAQRCFLMVHEPVPLMPHQEEESLYISSRDTYREGRRAMPEGEPQKQPERARAALIRYGLFGKSKTHFK